MNLSQIIGTCRSNHGLGVKDSLYYGDGKSNSLSIEGRASES